MPRLLRLIIASAAFGLGMILISGHRNHSFPGGSEILPIQQTALRLPVETPPRSALAEFRDQQNLLLEREDGYQINVGYTSVIVDPRWTTVEFYGGWNREGEANTDPDALVFTSGPTFARGHGNGELAMRLHGDLLLGNGQWQAANRAAARQRAWMGINQGGELEFGYGPLTEELAQDLRVFVGGLHAVSNTTATAPASYRGVYGEMHLADVRIIYGLRTDGRLELVETDDGLLFSDIGHFVEAKQFLAAYLPDHASKSRLIVPGQRHWDEEQAIWVSGGRPSITQMPYLLKIVPNEEWKKRQQWADGIRSEPRDVQISSL